MSEPSTVCDVFFHVFLLPWGRVVQAQKDAIHPTPVFELLGLALEEFVDKADGKWVADRMPRLGLTF